MRSRAGHRRYGGGGLPCCGERGAEGDAGRAAGDAALDLGRGRGRRTGGWSVARIVGSCVGGADTGVRFGGGIRRFRGGYRGVGLRPGGATWTWGGCGHGSLYGHRCAGGVRCRRLGRGGGRWIGLRWCGVRRGLRRRRSSRGGNRGLRCGDRPLHTVRPVPGNGSRAALCTEANFGLGRTGADAGRPAWTRRKHIQRLPGGIPSGAVGTARPRRNSGNDGTRFSLSPTTNYIGHNTELLHHFKRARWVVTRTNFLLIPRS